MEYLAQKSVVLTCQGEEIKELSFIRIFAGKTAVIAVCTEETDANLILEALKIYEELTVGNDTVQGLKEAIQVLTGQLKDANLELGKIKALLKTQPQLLIQEMFDPNS